MTPISDILTITHKNITDNNYEVNFKFNISKEACIEAIYIKFNCDKCLAKINGFDVKNDGYFLIKPGKKEIYDDSLPDINTETNFVVNKTQFNYSILLNNKKNSKDYLKFLESFGEASVNKGQFDPSDTIYKYESIYKIN